jgi:hypothetical protein
VGHIDLCRAPHLQNTVYLPEHGDEGDVFEQMRGVNAIDAAVLQEPQAVFSYVPDLIDARVIQAIDAVVAGPLVGATPDIELPEVLVFFHSGLVRWARCHSGTHDTNAVEIF